MIEGWVSDLADEYWEAAGDAPPPPRDLLVSVPLALPLAVVTLPVLGIGRVRAWLANYGVDLEFRGCDRRLHGCLVAQAGQGMVFVDGADAPDERRFTLAHEVAHFLVDYRRPRERAIRRLGASITAVLDGVRLPTDVEEIHAGLVGCSLGVHVHLLERVGDLGAAAAAAEDRVDRLAWELLAPAELVSGVITQAIDEVGKQILKEKFGLPESEAGRYARFLRRAHGSGPTFVDWLRP